MIVTLPEHYSARPQNELVRRQILGAFFTLLSGAVIFGCSKSGGSSPNLSDSSKMVVQPGRGIPKICEIGMSFKEVRKATGEASRHGIYDRKPLSLRRLTQDRFVLVPSLGVIGVPEKKGALPLLTFYVQPYDSSITIPGLTVTNPFRGSISTNLFFSSNSVSRKAVESNFGVVTQNLTNYADFSKLIDVTKPYSFRDSTLFYPQLGLSFDLKNDRVESFSVYKPQIVKRP